MPNSDPAKRLGGLRRKRTNTDKSDGPEDMTGAGIGPRRRPGAGQNGPAGVRQRRIAERRATEDRALMDPDAGDVTAEDAEASVADRAGGEAVGPQADVPQAGDRAGRGAHEDAPAADRSVPDLSAGEEADHARSAEQSDVKEPSGPARAAENQAGDGGAEGPGPEKSGGGQGGGQGGRRGRRGNAGQAEPKVVFIPPPTVPTARPRRRHWAVLFSFFLLVLVPFAISAWYLYERAVDQYASTLGFSVRKQDATSNFEDLGSAFGIGGQSSSDTDVLYEFIQSQALVSIVDAQLDLRTVWSKAPGDPVFSIRRDSTIEELVDYWQRMVTIYYDSGSGLMEVRVRAFDPQDAQNITHAIFEESSSKINALTAIARDDSTRYARTDLEAAEQNLKIARAALTEFRARTQIVDPNADIQIQIGLLGTLNQQLATTLIDLDTITLTARDGDPRIRQMEQRIEVIENRIAEERKKFGIGETDGGGGAFATLVNEYEELSSNVQFATNSYEAARTNYAAILAEATRQSRYLAPHIPPTLAQSAEYPQRGVVLSVLGLILFMVWAIGAMLYYSVKDRR